MPPPTLSGQKEAILLTEGRIINAARVLCAAASALGITQPAAAPWLVTSRWRFISLSDDATFSDHRSP